jgi:hypothetical protein
MIIVQDKTTNEILYLCKTQSKVAKLIKVNYNYLRRLPKNRGVKTIKNYRLLFMDVE